MRWQQRTVLLHRQKGSNVKHLVEYGHPGVISRVMLRNLARDVESSALRCHDNVVRYDHLIKGVGVCVCVCVCLCVRLWRMASLLVEILCAGDGTKYPKKGETVTLHYIGYVRAAAVA